MFHPRTSWSFVPPPILPILVLVVVLVLVSDHVSQNLFNNVYFSSTSNRTILPSFYFWSSYSPPFSTVYQATSSRTSDEGENRIINLVNMDTIRCNNSLPSSIRSSVQTFFATRASKQDAHSAADPLASSKNRARSFDCLFPLPSAVLKSADRLAQSK